jgi:hypothetical protein
MGADEAEIERAQVALRALEPVRAGDLADWLGSTASATLSLLRELERRGVARKEGEFWASKVVEVPIVEVAAPEPTPQPTFDPEPTSEPAPEPEPMSQAAPEPTPARVRRPKPSPALAKVHEHRQLLGTMPDLTLARQLGVSHVTIANYRAEHDLVASQRYTGPRTRAVPPEPVKPPVSPKRSATSRPKAVAHEVVAQAKEPAPERKETEPPVAPALVAAREAEEVRVIEVKLWTAVVQAGDTTTEHTIAAVDMAEAAKIALAALGDDVLRITLIGRAIARA